MSSLLINDFYLSLIETLAIQEREVGTFRIYYSRGNSTGSEYRAEYRLKGVLCISCYIVYSVYRYLLWFR